MRYNDHEKADAIRCKTTRYAPRQNVAKSARSAKMKRKPRGTKLPDILQKMPEDASPIEKWVRLLGDDRFADDAIKALVSYGTEALPAVIQAFVHPANRSMYENASEVLVLIGEPAVDPLIELLQQGKWGAGWVLGQLGAVRAIPYFIEALKSKDSSVRWVAAEGLLNLNAVESVPVLILRLRDRAHLVRSTAVQALGKFGDATAIAPLMARYTDRSEGIQQATRDAVAHIQARERSRILSTLR